MGFLMTVNGVHRFQIQVHFINGRPQRQSEILQLVCVSVRQCDFKNRPLKLQCLGPSDGIFWCDTHTKKIG